MRGLCTFNDYSDLASSTIKSVMSTPMEIKFRSRLSDDEQQRLISYLSLNERSSPIAFEGRDDVRNHIEKRITVVRETAEPTCSTVVVQGAPGAGKTSLLHQIKQDALDMPSSSDIIPILIEIEQFNDPVLFLEKFLVHGRGNLESISKSYSEDGKGTFNLSVLKFEGGIQSHLPALDQRVRESPGRIWNVIRQSLHPGDNPIFLLLVDESQRIQPNSGKYNTLLVNLHGAMNIAELRIISVFAGLSDTRERLKDVGPTRLLPKRFNLGTFTEVEGRKVCLSTFEKLNVTKLFTDKNLNFIVHQLEYASDRWPRHLHCCLHHFINEISDAQRKKKDHFDLNKVLDLGNDDRITYYQEQLEFIEPDLSDAVLNLAKLQKDKKVFNYKDIKVAFLDCFSNSKELLAFVNLCVHKGVLDRNLDRTYSFPIPSLKTFLANDMDADRTKEILRERMRE